MFQLVIPQTEYYNEASDSFVMIREQSIQIEHSLVSLSKWEAKWVKPFLGKENKSFNECVDYIRCMTLTQNVDPIVYGGITADLVKKVNEYIEAPMCATWFNERPGGPKNREIITAEVIYYWMIALGIPFECQKWHLNKLMALIRVCNIKNTPPKKMSRKDLINQNKNLNAARRGKMNTHG